MFTDNGLIKGRIFYFSLLGLVVLLTTSCSFVSVDSSPTIGETKNCFVDTSAFPQSWTITSGPDTRGFPDQVLPGRAMNGGSVSFFHPLSGARAHHDVLLYSNEKKSLKEYERQQPGFFFSSGRLSPWETPKIDYGGGIADEYRLACADFEGIDENQQYRYCSIMGRYGQFLSQFSTWMSPDYMSEAELVHVLKAIDERMTTCTKSISD